jgi:hypothetical protein
MKFEVIIKDKVTGEIHANVECDSVVCGYSGIVSDDTTHAGILTLHEGNVFSEIAAIGAAEKAVAKVKKHVCEGFEEKAGIEVTYEFIEMAFREATSQIEVDEDAIKSMMEGRNDEC